MLTLPMLVPALLAAIESFRAVLAGHPLSKIADWLVLGGAFVALFVAACLLLFECVLED